MLKLFRLLRPYRGWIVFVMALILLQSLSDLYLPTLMADIVNEGIVKRGGDTSYIMRIGGFMLVVALVGAVFSIIASLYSSRIAAGFGRIARARVFSRVENYSLQEFDKIGTSSLITRTTNDINQVQQVLVMMLRMMVAAPMMCIGGIIMAVSKDATLSLVLVVAVPVLVLTIFLVARQGIPLFRVIQKKLDKLNLVLREGLTGIRVIRSFGRIEHEKKRFVDANADLTNTSIKVNQIMAVLWPLMMLIMNFSQIAIIWFGGLRIGSGHMAVGDLMAFLQYAMQIMFSMLMLSMMFVMVPRAAASAVRINEVLDMSPVVNDAPHTKTIQERKGQVEFDNVTFSYPGAETPALTGISFRAEPGEVTAIIGGTGSGKSTLVNLIPRFYDVQSGSIHIDGVDLRERKQADLRAQIGLVPQKAVLFTGSIEENIRFGKEDATEDEIRHAAEIAQATEFISGMAEGYASPIAQGGANVSGGQKQRLSIARALVRKPDIYIFDDSFSALDFKTDARLRAALKAETTQSTVIIVAQRVSTVMDADRIIVLDEGSISAIGHHKQLMQESDVYREIVSSQLSEEESA